MSIKLKQIFLISIPFFVAHGVEEYLTGFYKIDLFTNFVFGYFANLPTAQAVFLVFQIMFWLILAVTYLLLVENKWQMFLMFVFGIILIFELDHLYNAIKIGGYYSGLVTAFALYVIGFFFWRELIKNYKQR